MQFLWFKWIYKKNLLEKQNEELIALKRIESSIESEKNRDSNQNDTKIHKNGDNKI